MTLATLKPPTLRALALWGGLALAASGFAYFNLFSWYPNAAARYNIPFSRALTWELLRWNLWLPIAAWILRSQPSWKPPLAARYIAAALVVPAVHSALLVAANFLLSPTGIAAMISHRPYVLAPDYFGGVVLTVLALGLAHARGGESRASALEVQLAQSQLDALKMQLQPHFLFNTLNAVSALQMEDPDAAQRMLARLATFLRMTLEASAVHQVSLEQEVQFLARYLEIEKVRFPDRLTVEYSLDPDALSAMVPNLILQPIVENAICHGISRTARPGRVQIHASRCAGSLHVSVDDTGPGADPADPIREGHGLSITRARLLHAYGGAARLRAGNAPGGGFTVSIEIPFLQAPAAPAA